MCNDVFASWNIFTQIVASCSMGFQSVVFDGCQKMAVRAFLFIMILTIKAPCILRLEEQTKCS